MGLKGEAGAQAFSNWKQCVWKAPDNRDFGLIKVKLKMFTFIQKMNEPCIVKVAFYIVRVYFYFCSPIYSKFFSHLVEKRVFLRTSL